MPKSTNTQANLKAPLPYKKRLQRQRNMALRVIQSGCVNFVRNAWLSIAAIAMMVITLTIILLSLIANQAFNHSVQQITDRIDISVYLKDDITQAQTDKFIDDLKRLQNVREVTYLSKDDVVKENPDLLFATSQIDNPFPATVRIKPVDANNIDAIKNFLEKEDIKALQSEETSYSGKRKEAIDNITKTARFFGQIGALAVLVFAGVSVLIIFNTIQMAIFNRRDELSIMQLLGANPRYIRGPFLVEAFLYGVIAGVLSLVIVKAMLQVQTTVFGTTSSGLLDIAYTIEYLSNNFFRLLALQLGLGVGIAVLSANFATRRHLRKSRKASSRR